jgi:hypothetical protein
MSRMKKVMNELSIRNYRAAKYLSDVNPKRYVWEKEWYAAILIDMKDTPKTHTRHLSKHLVKHGVYDRVPLFQMFIETDHDPH